MPIKSPVPKLAVDHAREDDKLESARCQAKLFQATAPRSSKTASHRYSPAWRRRCVSRVRGNSHRCRGASRCGQRAPRIFNEKASGLGVAMARTPPPCRLSAAASRRLQGSTRCSRLCQRAIARPYDVLDRTATCRVLLDRRHVKTRIFRLEREYPGPRSHLDKPPGAHVAQYVPDLVGLLLGYASHPAGRKPRYVAWWVVHGKVWRRVL